ncbi:MAG: hypothetical protein ACREGK_09655 [Geminicoccales bacterium]
MIDIARLRKQLRAGRISRRTCMNVLAVAGVVAATGGRRPARADETPLVFLWAGYDDPALYPSYVAKYGRAPDSRCGATRRKA